MTPYNESTPTGLHNGSNTWVPPTPPPLPEHQKPLVQLIDALNNVKDLNFDSEDAAILTIGDISWPIVCSMAWHDGTGQATASNVPDYMISALLHNEYGKFVCDDDYAVLAPLDRSWVASDVLLKRYDRSISREGKNNTITVDIGYHVNGQPRESTASHIFVLGGIGLGWYADVFPPDIHGHGLSRDGFITEVFERPAVIRELDFKDDAGLPYMGVAYNGVRLSSAEQRVVLLILSLLTGRFGTIEAEIELDENGKETSRRLISSVGRPYGDAKPPISITASADRVVIDAVPGMVRSMCLEAKRLLDDGIAIDVALIHLLTDHRRLFDVEIRDITLALDSLIEAKVYAMNGSTLMCPKKYDGLLLEVEPAVRHAVQARGYGDAEANHILERLSKANDTSHGERRNKFWTAVGITLSEVEKAALRHRHAMSHKGFITRIDLAKYRALGRDVMIARTLVNRVILKLLGYEGPVLNYVTGQNQTWND